MHLVGTCLKLLTTLENEPLPGTVHPWLYQHLVPKLSWAFLILNLTLTFVKKQRALS